MKHRLVIIFVLLLSVIQDAFSQNSSGPKAKEDGVTVTVLNKGAMMQGKDVKGYYMFYRLDKADKANDNYQIAIYDNSFNEVNTFELKKPKYFSLREATYNGQAFLFLFIDTKKKSENLISFDKTGKVIKDITLPEMDMAEYASTMQSQISSKPNENVEINAVTDKGFLKFDIDHNKKEKKTSFSVNFYSNDLKKIWTVEPPLSDQNKWEVMQPISYDNKYLIGLILGTDSRVLTASSFKFSVIAVNVESGKKVFQAPLQDDRYSVVPSGAFYDEPNKQFVVLGEYTDAKEKLGNGRSNGVAMIAFDENGKPKSQKYLSWAKDVSKFISVDSKGKLNDGGYLSFQKMISTSDGKIFAVAEQYKKVASGVGIAMAILGGGGRSSVVDIKIMDLMIFEFNSDFSISHVTTIDKPDHQISLPSSLSYYPLNVVSIFMKFYGDFDYNFLTPSSDGKTFSVCYDMAKDKAKDNVKIGNVVYTPEGKFVQSPIELKDKPTMYSALPAKWGYLGVTEYSRKEKKMTRRVEKLDY